MPSAVRTAFSGNTVIWRSFPRVSAFLAYPIEFTICMEGYCFRGIIYVIFPVPLFCQGWRSACKIVYTRENAFTVTNRASAASGAPVNWCRIFMSILLVQ